MFEHSVILCPEVRRVTCAESCPVPRAATPRAPWRWLFPPTPPFPWALAENLTCKSCLSKQVGGQIVQQWHCFCPLAGLSICCINYITVKSGGAAFFLAPSCLPMARHPLTVSRSPVCAPPFSMLNTQGCWNITDFIQHPPTRKHTLHLVIHLVPFTFCLITLCWQCGFLFFPFFLKNSESH